MQLKILIRTILPIDLINLSRNIHANLVNTVRIINFLLLEFYC